MSSVSISGLVKEFSGKRVLNGINLEIEQGELIVLLGPSGCGKTTLLRCLAGLGQADNGEIKIGGRDVDVPVRGVFVTPNKREIGVVFQSYALWPHMTVRSNVSYALKLAKEKPDVIRKRVDEALKSLNLLERAEEYAGDLSGGQQQRVALARAIASSPKLMLFDEPLSNLDAKLRIKVRTDIRKLHRQSGVTAVYVTHDQDEAMALADRIVVMNEGTIQQIGTPEELYEAPANTFVADFMGFENILPGSIETRGTESVFVTAAGEVPLDAKNSVDDTVNVMAARAEHLTITKVPAGEADEQTGTVLTHTYMGRYIEVIVGIGDQKILVQVPVDTGKRSASFVRGDRVKLSILDASKVVLLNDQSSHLEPTTGTMNVQLSTDMISLLKGK